MTSGGMPMMGGIFSFGSINATFSAGGDIQPASAVGSIGGSFSAGLSVGDLTAGGSITASTSGSINPFDTTLAGMTAPPIPASITSDVLLALGNAQLAMNQSVNDYFTAASQAQTDASTALATAQTNATNAMTTAQNDLTTSNNQIRTDANYAFNGSGNVNSIVATTNASYTAARTSANTAWSVLQNQVALAVTAAGAANSAAVTASGNMLSQMDADFAWLTTNPAGPLQQADAALTAERNQIQTQTTTDNTKHPEWWDAAYKAYRLQWWESYVIQPAQVVAGVATVFVTGGLAVPLLWAADIGLGLASLAINYEQGDTLGMFFDIVGLGLGVAPAFKSAFNWLRNGDDIARGACGALSRLGCFRGSTITYRLVEAVDNAVQDDNPMVLEFKPLVAPNDDQSAAMMACLVIGIGGWDWQRRRKRREEEERRAIDSVFGESPQDDGLWT